MKFCAIEAYPTKRDVEAEYPSAAVIVRVFGGWGVFPTISDYDVWRGQE